MANTTSTVYGDDVRGGARRVSWGAIFAGTVVGIAVLLMLALLGLGIGASVIEPGQPGGAANGVPTATPIWIFVSQLIALAVAGAIAGRLASDTRGIVAALHGATVWGLTTVAALWLATSAATGVANLVGSMIGGIGSGARAVAEGIVPDDLSVPNIADLEFNFQDLPPEVQSTLREQGITPQNFQTEMREAFNQVISRDERQAAVQAAQEALRGIVQDPSAAPQEIDELTDTLFGQILSEEDRQEALNQMEQRLGISREQAEGYLQSLEDRVSELQAQAAQTIQEAKNKAIEAADATAEATSTAGFLGFGASLLGLLAAMAAAFAARPRLLRRY
jgi:hypothetical protein